jgi:hypothetical protein
VAFRKLSSRPLGRALGHLSLGKESENEGAELISRARSGHPRRLDRHCLLLPLMQTRRRMYELGPQTSIHPASRIAAAPHELVKIDVGGLSNVGASNHPKQIAPLRARPSQPLAGDV